MENIREEFENWYLAYCLGCGMDSEDAQTELDREGEGYVYMGAQYAWVGWQAASEKRAGGNYQQVGPTPVSRWMDCPVSLSGVCE